MKENSCAVGTPNKEHGRVSVTKRKRITLILPPPLVGLGCASIKQRSRQI